MCQEKPQGLTLIGSGWVLCPFLNQSLWLGLVMLTSGTERRGTQSYWNQKDCVGERLVSQKENRGSVSRINRSRVAKTKTKTNSCPTSPEHLQRDVHRQPAVNLTHLLPNSISPTVFLSIIKVMINNLLNLETWRQPITLLTSSLVSAPEMLLICPFLNKPALLP